MCGYHGKFAFTASELSIGRSEQCEGCRDLRVYSIFGLTLLPAANREAPSELIFARCKGSPSHHRLGSNLPAPLREPVHRLLLGN